MTEPVSTEELRRQHRKAVALYERACDDPRGFTANYCVEVRGQINRLEEEIMRRSPTGLYWPEEVA